MRAQFAVFTIIAVTFVYLMGADHGAGFGVHERRRHHGPVDKAKADRKGDAP